MRVSELKDILKTLIEEMQGFNSRIFQLELKVGALEPKNTDPDQESRTEPTLNSPK